MRVPRAVCKTDADNRVFIRSSRCRTIGALCAVMVHNRWVPDGQCPKGQVGIGSFVCGGPLAVALEYISLARYPTVEADHQPMLEGRRF